MSISQSYHELNEIFTTLKYGEPSQINMLYDGFGANYTNRVHQLFDDIGIAPKELDTERYLIEYTDYLHFTKYRVNFDDNIHLLQREYDYMLPYPKDFGLLLELIKEFAFSPQEYQQKDFLLFNWIFEYINSKIKSKKSIKGYNLFVNDLQNLFPIIESTFQKANRTQSQMLYSLRSLLNGHRNQDKKATYGFLSDSVDEILISYGIIDIYLEFSQEDFVEFINIDEKAKDLAAKSFDFEQIQKDILVGIDKLIGDIMIYHNNNITTKGDNTQIVEILCKLMHYFTSLHTKFDEANRCRRLILFKIMKLYTSLGMKKSDYQDFLQINIV